MDNLTQFNNNLQMNELSNLLKVKSKKHGLVTMTKCALKILVWRSNFIQFRQERRGTENVVIESATRRRRTNQKEAIGAKIAVDETTRRREQND